MTDIKAKISQLQTDFVQGEITHFTGNESNALMESDVERISNSINTQLIDPVIDFVIACDEVIAETASEAHQAAEVAKNTADVADRTAGQSMSMATDALNKATTAESEATRAHTRLDELNIPTMPNLDNQTWNWLSRSFDSVSIRVGNGITLADTNTKPHITWTPIRQNFETGSYYVEGRFEARFKVMVRDWIQGEGGNIVYLAGIDSLASFNGWIYLDGLSSTDTMKPTNIQINAYTQKDSQVVFGASAVASMSDSTKVKMALFVNVGTDRFDQYTDPVYVDLVMTFQRDASGNFGFGTLFPELTPSSS